MSAPLCNMDVWAHIPDFRASKQQPLLSGSTQSRFVVMLTLQCTELNIHIYKCLWIEDSILHRNCPCFSRTFWQ